MRQGDTVSVMCDVINIRLKWKEYRGEMNLDYFYDVTHDTFRIYL